MRLWSGAVPRPPPGALACTQGPQSVPQRAGPRTPCIQLPGPVVSVLGGQRQPAFG
jgi:hypothetical protein